MSRPSNVPLRMFADTNVVNDAALHYLGFRKMSLINNEQDFLRLCANFDKLTNMGTPLKSADAIANDKRRGAFYFEATVEIAMLTRLNLSELVKLTDYIIETTKSKKRPASWREEKLITNVIKWARFCPFEPQWHMEYRGDTRPLPTTKGKDLWGHLRRLYTDPEASRLRTPDAIKKIAHLYPGYVKCCKDAIADGQAELKRIHGPNVDLTPLVDKRKDEEKDMMTLMQLLNSGEMGDILSSGY